MVWCGTGREGTGREGRKQGRKEEQDEGGRRVRGSAKTQAADFGVAEAAASSCRGLCSRHKALVVDAILARCLPGASLQR